MTQQPRRRRLDVEDNGDIAVVNFIDGRRKIILNFSNVDFLSSAALGKLITFNRKVQNVRGKLILCGISPDIREVFQITGLDKLITIHADQAAALLAF
ncbi:MAG: STAS domain-containing protein [Planctomycetes bacterium]|nr:STAS domain-containing protein [Planctomycetota bacterium]